MGIASVIFACWFAAVNHARAELLQTLPLAVFIGFLIAGISLGIYAFRASDKKVDAMAEAMSKEFVSLIFLAIAYPVYLVLSNFYFTDRNDT